MTLTDMTGREITLDEPATRIVALTPSDCEILYAIGAGDLLVGRGKYCDYPAEVTEIPAVESGSDTQRAHHTFQLVHCTVLVGRLERSHQRLDVGIAHEYLEHIVIALV